LAGDELIEFLSLLLAPSFFLDALDFAGLLLIAPSYPEASYLAVILLKFN
jgi:hypothetical protein